MLMDVLSHFVKVLVCWTISILLDLYYYPSNCSQAIVASA